MQSSSPPTSPATSPAIGFRFPSSPIQLVIGLGLLGAVLVFDLVTDRRPLAGEGPPILSSGYLVRSIVLLAASVAVVGGLAVLAERLPARRPALPAGTIGAAAATASTIALGATALVLWDPQTLSSLVREDRVVEWLSAILAFAAATLFLAAAAPWWRRRTAPSLLLAAFGGLCLLLGLEEISWFQRVFDVESPEFMLNRNGQQELNLHNLATDLSGNLYYVGAFAYGVLLPGLMGDRRLPSSLQWLQPLVPSRLVMYGSAPAAALVHEMWNISWIQLTLWMTLVLLVIDVRRSSWRPILGPVILVVAVTAWVFVAEGSAMVRAWDDTEVRELIIPFGLVLAGLEAAARARRWTDES